MTTRPRDRPGRLAHSSYNDLAPLGKEFHYAPYPDRLHSVSCGLWWRRAQPNAPAKPDDRANRNSDTTNSNTYTANGNPDTSDSYTGADSNAPTNSDPDTHRDADTRKTIDHFDWKGQRCSRRKEMARFCDYADYRDWKQ